MLLTSIFPFLAIFSINPKMNFQFEVTLFLPLQMLSIWTSHKNCRLETFRDKQFPLFPMFSTLFYPLPDMPNSDSSNSVGNQDMMSKIWTNGDIVF